MTQPRRGIGTTLIVVAIVIVLAVATIAFVVLTSQTSTPIHGTSSTTSSVTTSSSSGSSSTTYSTNSASGLRLQVTLNSSNIPSQGEVAVQVELLNTLSQNVSLAVVLNQNISGWNGNDFFCDLNPSHSLVGFALLKGHFAAANVSTVSPLQLVASSVALPCPYSLPLNGTTFLPNSDKTVSFSYYGQTEEPTYSVTAEVNATTGYCTFSGSLSGGCQDTSGILGYWNATAGNEGNSSLGSKDFTYLPPGEYTIVAMDDWGQTVYARFQVATTTTTTSITSSSQQSTTCIISGQPGPVFLRVISDSNQTPVGGAQVAATNQPAYCGNGVSSTAANSQTTVTFTTSSSTEWYSLDSENNAGFTFMVTYLGQTYTFTASLRPVSLTCATLYVPSGRTSVTIEEFQTDCNQTTTTTTSTSASQQAGSLSWDANYGAWNYEVTLNTNQIQPGQNITALFTLTNFSNRTQTVDLDNPLVLPTIYAQDGKVVWAWEPPAINEIENITAGQALSEPLTLPTWMLQAGQSYTLTTAPGFSVPGSTVDISQQLQLSQTITVA